MQKYRERSNKLAEERLEHGTDKAATHTDRQARAELKAWLDEYDETKKQISAINKVRDSDAVRYANQMTEMLGKPEYRRYEIIKAYKRSVDELTAAWLRAGTIEERRQYANKLIEVKEQMVDRLRAVSQ